MSDISLEAKRRQQALDYHSQGRPGKIELTPTKPTLTARDLALAYSPGVAEPCLEIAKNPDDVYKYTAKGNLVAVVSNGSAVLGLGDIGALASKPVMEGKGVLFKRFADIDVFDVEINAKTVEEMVNVVKALEPTFGGINLEDIKAPECFEVERQLKEIMNIPVFHDDQHGTAIIATAAFINALEVTKRKISEVKVVFSGAGAAAIACANLFLEMGVKKENLMLTDSKGVVYQGRTEGMNQYKEFFAIQTKRRTLADAMDGADAFVGCSAKGVLTKEMVKTMAANPIIFAMANPDPEITPEEVAEVRDDAIMATGRTDYPNQVNNVLGFPFIFRGALDVRATQINEAMKMAAVKAIAGLAKEEVPDSVKMAYANQEFKFGKNYLIPKPFDKRVLTRVAPAVAKAAMDSGVARVQIADFKQYIQDLEDRLGVAGSFTRSIRNQIPRDHKKRIIFSEGSNARILQAASLLKDEGFIEPILFGDPKVIQRKMKKMELLEDLQHLEIINPDKDPRYKEFSNLFYEQRQRLGVTISTAKELMKNGNYFCSMMVKHGHADGMITGTSENYGDCITPIMKVVGKEFKEKVAGIIILVFKNRVLFLADCTVQINPNASELSDIAISATTLYRKLMKKEPSVAFLSYSNFGSNRDPETKKIAQAVALTKEREPNLDVDGEMHADVAVNHDLLEKLFNFSTLQKSADILVFPELQSANISYKLLAQLAGATPIGPVLVPLKHAINIVQRTSSVDEIINMTHLTAVISEKIKRG